MPSRLLRGTVNAMNDHTTKAAFTYTSIVGALLVAMACGTDEAPSDVGTATGGAQTTETGGRTQTATGGSRAAGGRAGAGGLPGTTGGSAGADASVNGGTSGVGGSLEGGPDVSAGGQAGAGGAGGTGGAGGAGGTDAGPTDCFTNPTTHFEIINACTTAEKVDKTPVLPLDLPDGGLKPLP